MDNTTHLPDGYVKITIAASPEYLCVVRSAMQKCGFIIHMPPADIDGVILAMEEALTNIIRHGYGGRCAKPIEVEMQRVDKHDGTSVGLKILIRDFGRQVDPAHIKSRDLDDIRPGGLGVHIIQSVMDEVDYRPADDVGMLLRMVKYFVPLEPGESGAECKGSSISHQKKD